MDRRYDLVILGGGTAGLVAALVAAGIGARVALIERERTGGDCLWTGCVPSKSLLAAAHTAHRMRTADRVGLTPIEPDVDFARVMARVHAAIAAIEPHDAPDRLRAAGVEVLLDEGRLVDARTVAVGGRRLRTTSILVATGAAPAVPPIDGLHGDDVLTSETVWNLDALPGRLVVLGGGPIGCELGQAFARLGSAVTLVEEADGLLGHDEPDAGALVAARLRADGVDVRLDTRAHAVRRDAGGGGPRLVVAAGGRTEELPFDRILVATGRRPRTDGLGLDAAGVAVDEAGAVVTDARLRTTAKGVLAAGDVTGRLPFTHVAAHHARVAAINALLGTGREVDETIPWVTFTDPEVAHVGLTARQARERWGDRAVLARAEHAALDRAMTEAETTGFSLLVADRRGRLVGATVVGATAGEAIAELTARVKARDRIDAVSTTVHAYPTFAEGPSRAADEHLRERYGRRRYRVAATPVLAARRVLSARS